MRVFFWGIRGITILILGGVSWGPLDAEATFCYDDCLYSTGHVDMRLMDETIGREAFAVPAEITAK